MVLIRHERRFVGSPRRGPLIERKHDLYETPEEATCTLLRHQWLPKRIWEPAAGRGAISRVLTAARHQVRATDLVSYEGKDPNVIGGIDFLMELGSFDDFQPDAIVMNPPFKLYDEFIRHALTLVPLVCCFGRLMAIEGVGRSDYMRHCTRVLAGIQRLPMIHRDGWTGKRQKGGSTAFAWFIFTQKQPPTTILERVLWSIE